MSHLVFLFVILLAALCLGMNHFLLGCIAWQEDNSSINPNLTNRVDYAPNRFSYLYLRTVILLFTYMKNPNFFPIGSAFGFFVYIKDITY